MWVTTPYKSGLDTPCGVQTVAGVFQRMGASDMRILSLTFGVPTMQTLSRRFTLKAISAAALLSAAGISAHAAETIKVGVLHSLSGTMAISETVLKDTVLMAIDEINAKGPCLLKKPSSCWGRTRCR
jgi:ABC-type branched-subunit amino acid transport system substrate-binding protein